MLRDPLDKVHIALAYLLVVLGASATGGRTLGLVLAVASFLAFNFVFLPPFYTFVIADPRDWLVLFAFLATGGIAAQLFHREQREAEAARRRAAEVDRLAALGAETLSAGRARDALAAIARVVRETIGVTACEIYVRDDDAREGLVLVASTAPNATSVDDAAAHAASLPIPALVQTVAHRGIGAAERADGTVHLLDRTGADALGALASPAGAPRRLFAPLLVHGRTVGVLGLHTDEAFTLDTTRRRYLDALSYYAALGAERLRLGAEAEGAAALREADRLKDSLLATVSHDLRTPLTTIRGLAHDIAQGGDERALAIEEEVQRLDRFVSDLLDLSRLSAGGLPLRLALNAAEDLMGAALQRVGGRCTRHTIRASLDPTDPVLVGRFDFAHSLRILANLLENACKYAPTGSVIDFTVGRDGDTLVFRVADRGPGVPEAERARIFAPFYRAPGAPPDAGSAGLGLAIARGLAEAQQGSLTHTPREGGGSVFVLRLRAVTLDTLAALAALEVESPATDSAQASERTTG